MKYKGLSPKEIELSRKQNGSNILTQIPPEPLWKKILKGFGDPMILILIVALCVQTILCFLGQSEWYEPVGILAAILIANGVASISENSQENKASALKAEEEAKELAKVVRDGLLQEIHVSEIVCGDIVYLQAGDKISADGEIIDGALHADQATLNGETEEAEKIPCPPGGSYDIKDLLNRYYVYRGTVVCSGEAYMQVKVVGDRTLFGALALEVQEETRATPLQIKLCKLANQISMFGYIGAGAIVLGILAKTFLCGDLPGDFYGWVRLVMNAVTVAVTIIVCAVPEGLPMLTSILLSLQSLKMAKDNVLVRKINGLETAGSLNLLFSDKTGTITEGKLTVAELVTGDLHKFETLQSLPDSLEEHLITAIGVNNSASYSNGSVIGGNSTDRALMSFLASSHAADRIDKSNVVKFNAFNSTVKFSSVVMRGASGEVYSCIKGAPEKILERCTFFYDMNGVKRPLTDRKSLTDYLDIQANRCMRLLAVAKGDGDNTENGLALICLFCIRDNVRKEAVDAIHEVQEAGIQVVMVTGDRRETAVAIARESGLLRQDTDVVLTSSELAEKTDEEVAGLIRNLRVVARSLPTDKSRLVRIAQSLDLVVGMTGDGVNDSPALKKADVGFAMGSGTEVAKQAGDITILDDNFTSIRKAILYGRTMFKSIRKFLIFQLTVNVAAVLICFIGPLFGENVIMTVIQLLLINLAMDTLAAIAFGSEPALSRYMKEMPIPRSANIVSKDMFSRILLIAFYVTVVCLSILYFAPVRNLFGCVDVTYLKSALFATFMMAITFNGFNIRTADLNPFAGITKNKNFLIVMFVIFITQFIFVTFGGEALSVEPLSLKHWGLCALLAFLVIPIDMVRKILVGRIHGKTVL